LIVEADTPMLRSRRPSCALAVVRCLPNSSTPLPPAKIANSSSACVRMPPIASVTRLEACSMFLALASCCASSFFAASNATFCCAVNLVGSSPSSTTKLSMTVGMRYFLGGFRTRLLCASTTATSSRL
jgi:hypothetical protein